MVLETDGNNMKIFEAAKVVLSESKGPMHAKDIYEEIHRRELYKFGAKDPVSVLSQSLSERSVGNSKKKEEIFLRTAPGTYDIANRL